MLALFYKVNSNDVSMTTSDGSQSIAGHIIKDTLDLFANVVFADVDLIDGAASLDATACVDDVTGLSNIHNHRNVRRVGAVPNIKVHIDGLTTETGSIAAFLEESRLVKVDNFTLGKNDFDEVLNIVDGKVDGGPVMINEAASVRNTTVHDHEGLILTFTGVAVRDCAVVVLGQGNEYNGDESYRLDEHFAIDD